MAVIKDYKRVTRLEQGHYVCDMTAEEALQYLGQLEDRLQPRQTRYAVGDHVFVLYQYYDKPGNPEKYRVEAATVTKVLSSKKLGNRYYLDGVTKSIYAFEYQESEVFATEQECNFEARKRETEAAFKWRRSKIYYEVWARYNSCTLNITDYEDNVDALSFSMAIASITKPSEKRLVRIALEYVAELEQQPEASEAVCRVWYDHFKATVEDYKKTVRRWNKFVENFGRSEEAIELYDFRKEDRKFKKRLGLVK